MTALAKDDPVALIGEINASIETMKTEHKTVFASIKEASEKSGTDAKNALAAAEAAAGKIINLSGIITELEQKIAAGVTKGKVPIETLGELVIKSDAYKQYAAGNQSRIRIEANTLTGQSGDNSSDTIVAPYRLPGIIPGAYRQLRVRDALPSGVMSGNALEFPRELAYTTRATEVAEAAQKPESDLTFELVTLPVRTIAHFIKATKQILEDSTALRSYIDSRMAYGVELRYEIQLIKGNGSGQNISGMLDSGNYTAFNPVGANQLDNVNRAIQQVYEADYAPTAIMMGPADWFRITRLKVGTSDARYIVGEPNGMPQPMLWGLPVIISNSFDPGTFIVAAFDIAYQVWNRSGTVVEMFEQDDTNVQKNLVTIRAECRGLLASYRPASVRAGQITTANS